MHLNLRLDDDRLLLTYTRIEIGAAGRIRTYNFLITSQALYQFELQQRWTRPWALPPTPITGYEPGV